MLKMADDEPHVELPDGTMFDLCIERLGTAPGDEFYPVGTSRWIGDATAWEKWKEFLLSKYSPGGDLGNGKVRLQIRLGLKNSDMWPYMEFSTGTIKLIPNPNRLPVAPTSPLPPESPDYTKKSFNLRKEKEKKS